MNDTTKTARARIAAAQRDAILEDVRGELALARLCIGAPRLAASGIAPDLIDEAAAHVARAAKLLESARSKSRDALEA